MRVNKIIKNKIFLVIMLIIFTGCNDYKDPIKISISNWPPCQLWYIAQEKGYFGDTTVEIIKFSIWSDSINSLYTGKTDLVHSTYFNTLYYDSKGEKGKIILSSDKIYGADGLVVKNYIVDIKDLEGEKIAVEVGTDEHFLLHKVLEKEGLKEDDIIIIPADSEEGMKKFIAGEVDACFTYEPYLSQALKEGKGKIIARTTDEINSTDAMVARSKILKERKKDYANIIHAWYRAQEFVKENPEEAYQLMASKSGMTLVEFKGFYEKFEFFSLEENKNIFSSKDFKDELKKIETFLRAKKLILNEINTDEIFDSGIVNLEVGDRDE